MSIHKLICPSCGSNHIVKNGIAIQKSEIGFMSNTSYVSSPFVEKIINEKKYELMTNGKTKLLLSSSNSNFSLIGTRFKSMQNGFINNPFYSRKTQNNLGTDSVAYRGLLRG